MSGLNLVNHAKRELALIGMYESDEEMNNAMSENILELLEVFSNQGHSGFSASYCIQMFSKLASFEVIAPITGDDSEWTDVSDFSDTERTKLFQNKRASNVFKEIAADGTVTCYQSDRTIFREPDGVCFTRGGENGSRGVITEWPYTPYHEYVDMPPEEAVLNGNID